MDRDYGILTAGIVFLILGITFLVKRERYFSEQTWRNSRALQRISPLLVFIPGMEPERQYALKSHDYRNPGKLLSAARIGRIAAGVFFVLLGAVTSLLGLARLF